MKIIGLDVGTVRIGVAKADSKVKIAVPAGSVLVDGEEFEQIARLARVYGTECFVIGLPRNTSGQETKQSAYVRKFADALKAKIPNAKVNFQDETLTTVEAKERLRGRKAPLKKQKKSGDLDSEAAVIILQDYLEHFVEKAGGKLPKAAQKNTSKSIEKSRRPGRKIKIALITLITVLCVLGAAFGGAVFWYNNALVAVGDCDDCITQFTVADGSSTGQIAFQLESAGLIRSGLAFQIYTKLNNLDGQYKSGDYNLTKNLSVSDLADLLVKGSSSAAVFRFTILPGETIASIKAKLIKEGYSAEAVEAAFSASYDHPVIAGRPAGASLEGYLYGETYEFYKDESVSNIIIRALDELYKVVQENNLEEAFAAQGLSLFEGITLASVVQKEAKTADMPTVAQVFLTRLEKSWMLGSDVTTQYSLDLIDPNRETYQNNSVALKVEECHNTRLYAGLPCGPISNPGQAALLAVAHPADSTYLYFLTGDDGLMYYSYTEAEHNQNIRSHCRELCNVSL